MKHYEKAAAYITLSLLVAGLIPLMWLGKYNHPTGDDYYYGVETSHIWASTHDLGAVLTEAAKGVALQYQEWQGTYSAMFLMYLPPNIFGDGAYHLVTAVILLCLTGGIFYLLRQLLCGFLKGSTYTWIAVSSVSSMLCIQTIAFPEESFFWYNGSMYYTGFFSLSLFFLGLLCRYLYAPKRRRLLLLVIVSLLLAGANYVSFLPTFLLTLLTLLWLFGQKRPRQAKGVLPVVCAQLAGFAVSALAPGNRLRQADMWRISPLLAICKALWQGVSFLRSWIGLWVILAFLILAPLLWSLYENTAFRFPYPLPVLGLAYGVLCSMACPTYYTMNTIGPARAVAIMYYGFLLFLLFSYGYLLGYVHRLVREGRLPKLPGAKHLLPTLAVCALICVLIQGFTGAFADCTGARAIRCLASGEAAGYEAEYQERLALLTDPSLPVIRFSPYRHQADMLYVGDLGDDPTTPTNMRVAEYFYKQGISVDWSAD